MDMSAEVARLINGLISVLAPNKKSTADSASSANTTNSTPKEMQ